MTIFPISVASARNASQTFFDGCPGRDGLVPHAACASDTACIAFAPWERHVPHAVCASDTACIAFASMGEARPSCCLRVRYGVYRVRFRCLRVRYGLYRVRFRCLRARYSVYRVRFRCLRVRYSVYRVRFRGMGTSRMPLARPMQRVSLASAGERHVRMPLVRLVQRVSRSLPSEGHIPTASSAVGSGSRAPRQVRATMPPAGAAQSGRLVRTIPRLLPSSSTQPTSARGRLWT